VLDFRTEIGIVHEPSPDLGRWEGLSLSPGWSISGRGSLFVVIQAATRPATLPPEVLTGGDRRTTTCCGRQI